jgi:hypothetical protein
MPPLNLQQALFHSSYFWDRTLGQFIPVHSLRAIARVPAIAGGIIWLSHVKDEAWTVSSRRYLRKRFSRYRLGEMMRFEESGRTDVYGIPTARVLKGSRTV